MPGLSLLVVRGIEAVTKRGDKKIKTTSLAEKVSIIRFLRTAQTGAKQGNNYPQWSGICQRLIGMVCWLPCTAYGEPTVTAPVFCRNSGVTRLGRSCLVVER